MCYVVSCCIAQTFSLSLLYNTFIFTLLGSSPSQVINHYYVYLKGHMDADSVSHMMHYKCLITDDDFKAISAAPNDDKRNILLLQYVRSMDLSSLLKFIEILKSIESQESIGHHLELCM